ncbi:IclR family transcriptional regulator [Amycolatopsis anabasis]|uniref:IclR family transcriptional regulator n=1 Tax=Amycolatopsis anabasis TaxID=1840409 RepID=UPI00131D2611|nr:IclR family transcriptional regulator [Amycolatopsis anabasis]
MQTPGSARPVPQYPIESVDRALRLLLMFRASREIRLSDARDALEVGQSTAHRLMAMLVYHGFVDQDPVSRVYRAGPALVDIGLSVVRQMDVRALARPVLEWLAGETDETVHLGVLEAGQVRFVDVVESERALRVSGRVGRLLPAHATSLGKAMLAQLPADKVRELYPGESLEPVTGKTMTERSALLAELARVRKRGYAVNAGESEDGVSSVGIALTGPGGAVVGGLSVGAPSNRMTRQHRERYGALLAEARDRLAHSFG